MVVIGGLFMGNLADADAGGWVGGPIVDATGDNSQGFVTSTTKYDTQLTM